MTLLVKFLARTLVLTALYAAAIAIIDVSETTDPLGPGLLLFLAFILIALVWGVFDGRGAARQAILVWLLVAAAMGAVLILGTALLDDTTTVDAGEVGGTMLFTTVLLFPPALIGIGIGALLGRTRD